MAKTPTNENDDDAVDLPDRRNLFQITAATAFASVVSPSPAHAGSLVLFPVGSNTQILKNRYHFMRAGLSELEEQSIYSTNPLFLTNRENELSSTGESVVLNQALKTLKSLEDGFPTIAYHSLAANGMDTGDLIARELRLGREKLLPEFTYLDQRGIGLWDSGDEALVKPAVWALDYNEAGMLGEGGLPPAHEDGTPNETLGDQFVRLRQFISLQESRTSGDNILVIFPDGTGPALLSCMIAGVPYKDVHALEFAPGELRLDISPESVWELFEQRKDDPTYLATLKQGQKNLKELQEHPPVVALKEQKMQEERMELEAAFVEKQKVAAQLEQERQEALARQKEMMKQNELQRKEEQQRKAEERKAEQERRAITPPRKVSTAVSPEDKKSHDSFSLIGTAALSLGGLGFALLGTNGASSDSDASPSTTSPNNIDPTPSSSEEQESLSTAADADDKASANMPVINDHSVETESKTLEPATTSPSLSTTYEKIKKPEQSTSLPSRSEKKPEFSQRSIHNAVTTTVTDDEEMNDLVLRDQFDQSLAAEEQTMKEVLMEEVSESNQATETISEEENDDRALLNQFEQLSAGEQVMKDVLQEEFSKRNEAKKTTTYIDDNPEDYADDWLQIISEIRDEIDDEENEIELPDVEINRS